MSSSGARYVVPFATAFDTVGVVSPGALLYFYETGTDTPADTFSNVGLTVANTNPVVANGAGLFGNIYLTSQLYKVKLTTADGDEIWTADPVFSSGGNVSTGAYWFITTTALLAAFPATTMLGDGTIATTSGRTAQGQGGATFYYDASDTTTADNGGTIRVDAQGRRWYVLYNGEISVAWFGAKGDGSTDDTSAQQNAINAVPSGGTLRWEPTASYYKTSAALTVASPMTIIGGGVISQITSATNLFTVTSGDVTIDGTEGLTLTGLAQSWPATYVGDENAVTVSGTFHAGSAPDNISNVTVKNLHINNWGDYGILARYVDGFMATGNTILNIVDAGTELISVVNFIFSENSITNVTGVGMASSNAYGFSASRYTLDSGDTVSQPNSGEGVVASNIINGVPTWNGIDTHSGYNIAFIGNKIYNAARAYAIGASKNSSGDYTYAPTDISISGGVVSSGVTDGSYQEGVSFTGVDATTQATGSVTGLTIRGYGDETNATSAAIVLSSTVGVSITGNFIYYPGSAGISANSGNDAVTVAGNSIIDPWSNTAAVVGVRTVGDNNRLTVVGNSIIHQDKSATYLLTTSDGAGVRFGTGTDVSAIVSGNQNDGYTPIVDVPGNVTSSVTANETTPVVVSNAFVTANSIITLTPKPGQTGKGAFISAIVAGTSFSVTSLSGDTSIYIWQLQQ